ncbi:MAG: hypothetical protein Kow0037_31170 [Calditrichia bacterium]
MKSYNIWYLAIFIGLLIGGVLAQNVQAEKFEKLDPLLQSTIRNSSAEDWVDAYAVMEDQLTYTDLMEQVGHLPKKERRKAVTEILKNHAAATQRNLTDRLQGLSVEGKVKDVLSIWINNVVAFRAKPEVFRQLAENSPEVRVFKADARYDFRELTDDNGISEYNEENGLYFPGGARALQPGLTLINVPQVWAEGDSGQGVLVANLDTGTDWKHPDLAENIWNNLGEDADGDGRTMEFTGSTWIFDPGDQNGIDDDNNGFVDDFIGWNYESNNNDPSSGSSHGTATSGIVAGNGTNGTQTGVAPKAKLIILKPNGQTQYWAAQQYALEKGADVVTSSLSYKWYFSPQPDYAQFRLATDVELAAGIVHTNSTSNDGNTVGVPFNISAPGCNPSGWIHPDQTLVGGISSVIGSANVNASSDIIASSSPQGPFAWEDYSINHPSYPYNMPIQYQDYPYETQPGSMGLIKPDVAAPGNGTTSTAPGGGYQSFSGTSGATPHLAGVAALILSANPDLEPGDVSRIMQTTAVEKGSPGKDNRYGAGRVNAYAAYLQAFAEAGVPFAPTELTVYSDYQTPTQMHLTWQDPSALLNGDTLLAGDFHIHIIRDSVRIDSIPSGVEEYWDSGLNDGQLYHYAIYAKVDSTKRMSASLEAEWIAGGSPIPRGVSEVGMRLKPGGFMFYWKAPGKNIDGTPMDDYDGVNLYRDSVMVAHFSRATADTARTDSAFFADSQQMRSNWYLTCVDNESPPNESVASEMMTTPMNAPLADNFANWGEPNAWKWQNENADINDRADNPPTGPLALNLNGKPAGGDILISYPVDLTGRENQGFFFSYFYQPQGNGNAPEHGDSLLIYFINSSGEWVLAEGHPGTSLQPFQKSVLDLTSLSAGDGTFFHSQFQVKIRSIGSASSFTPNDDWFVDDVYLGPAGAFLAFNRDTLSFDTTQVGSVSQAQIAIQNMGTDTLLLNQWVTADSQFTVSALPPVIPPAGIDTLTLQFVPINAGWQSSQIGLVGNGIVDTTWLWVGGLAEPGVNIYGADNLPFTYRVSANYPNPFNPTTTIKFQIPETQHVRLTVYNMLGQKVKTLVNSRMEAGYHRVEWDGQNEVGQSVASGIYFYRFQSGPLNTIHKMILLK